MKRADQPLLENDISQELKSKFILEKNTLKRVIKSNVERKIEIEYGDATEPAKYLPQQKVKWFDNEYNRSVRADVDENATVRFDGGKIIYERTDGIKVIQYDKPDAGDEGGSELEWEIPERPNLSKGQDLELGFTLRHKGRWTYHKQLALTEEFENGYSEEFKQDIIVTETHVKTLDGHTLVHRPENIVGSYVAYTNKSNFKKGGKNYGTGQQEIIYRPKAVDAQGNEFWLELQIPHVSDPETNIPCKVIVSNDVVDKAVYPLRIDPTFGFTTIGGTSQGNSSDQLPYYQIFPALNGGTITGVSVYYADSSPATHTIYGYLNQFDGNPYTDRSWASSNSDSQSVNFSSTGSGWFDFTFSVGSFSQYVAIGGLPGYINGITMKYNTISGTKNNVVGQEQYAGGYNYVYQDRKYSIYATYTLGGYTSATWHDPLYVENDNTVGTLGLNKPLASAKQNDVYSGQLAFTGTYVSEYLKATNFQFNIPTGATINGVELEVDKNGSGTITDEHIRLVKSDGTISSTNKADTSTNWANSDTDTYTSYGGASDTWGESLTPSDVNDEDFGVVISADVTHPSSLNIDHVRLRVYYSTGETTNPSPVTSTGAVPAPTTSFQSVQSTSPSPVTSTGAIVAPTVTFESVQSTSPSPVASTGAIPAVTTSVETTQTLSIDYFNISFGQDVSTSPATVSATGAVTAPTVTFESVWSSSPSSVASTGAIPSVTTTFESAQSVSVSPVTSTGAVPSVTVQADGDVVASVNPVTSTGAVPTVGITYILEESTSPSPVTSTGAVTSPTITVEAEYSTSASPVSSTGALPAVTTSYVLEASTSPNPVTATGAVPAVTTDFVGDADVSVSPLLATGAVPLVTVTSQHLVNVSPVTATGTVLDTQGLSTWLFKQKTSSDWTYKSRTNS